MGYTADDFIRAAKAIDIEEKRQYTETEEKYQKHFEICNRLNDLYISKNKEYGDSFGKAYKRLGKTSAITQIYHKFERVLEIYDKEDIEYESLEDNLIDTANYIIMLLVEMESDIDNKKGECKQ